MSSNKFKAQVKANTVKREATDGHDTNPEFLTKALQKAERWMRNAYGGVDWEAYVSEHGSEADVHFYYRECVHMPDPGAPTFNRQTERQRRQGVK